ncbi:MAG: type II toxin-antitoxin system RelE/ParE family toxin [Chitinophagaceae bacterium]
MAFPYRLNPQAHEEYIEAYAWYEEKQPGLGNRFMNSVERRLQQISEHPEYFGKRKNNRFREAKVEHFPYMIVYEFFKQKRIIHIAAIYHSSRRPGSKYRRMK